MTTTVAFTIKSEVLTISAKTSEDKMKLFIDVDRAGHDPVTDRMIMDLLEQKLPKELINVSVIADIAQHLTAGKEVKDRRITKGELSQDGADGKLVFMVRQFTGVAEPGSTYFDLALFDNVKPGDVVARLYPPKNGVDGIDATGKKIPAKAGKPIKVNLDKSIEQRAGGGDAGYDSLVATAEGYLSEDGGKLIIKNELSISGNVDFHIGNLNFIGKIKVSADVMPKFRLEAKSDIEIYGSIRGENRVISNQGSVTVKGFAFGGKDSAIIAGKDIDLDVAQELTAEAVANIFLKKEAQSCILRSGKAILGTKAKVSGGSLFAVCGIELHTLGNPVGTPTQVILCSSIETTTEYLKLTSEIQSHDKALGLLEMHLGPFAKNSSRIQLLKSPHKEKMENLLKKFNQVSESKKNLLEKKKTMLSSGISSATPRVSVHGAIYPGVEIHAGEEVFTIPEPILKPTSIDYVSSEKKFVVDTLKPLSC